MRRLFEDPEQPQALRDELVRSREAGRDYPADDKLALLQAALADGPRQPVELPRAVHPAWKLALVAAASGGAVAWLVWPVRSPERHVTVPVVQPAEPAPVPPPTAAEPAADQPPTAAAEAPEPEAPAQATPAKSSRREIAQLIRIRALLHSDPAAAQRLAERSEREFPFGLLSEERRALSIVALAKTGARERAVAKAREFFARYPQSPMRGLIEAELK